MYIMRCSLVLMFMVLFRPSVSQEVQLNIRTQPVWPPGKAVVVTVEISKGPVAGFARFFQDLPQGFYVEKINSSGADFYWENNQVNLVWVILPDDRILRCQYLVTADESLGGSFRLGGRFDYIINGRERRSVESEPILIRLNKNAAVSEVTMMPFDTLGIENEAIKGDTIQVVDAGLIEKPVYRVQVAISSQSLTKSELEERIGCELEEDIIILRSANMYKYQTGSYSVYNDAQEYLAILKSAGVSDAFIVAYLGNEQISVEQAKSFEK